MGFSDVPIEGTGRRPGWGHMLASVLLGARPRNHQAVCGEREGPGW